MTTDPHERRILDALLSAGGSSQRHDLRVSIHPSMSTADFDRSIATLAARGVIRAELRTHTWRSPKGHGLPHQVMVYTLIRGRRRRSPSPVPAWPKKGGPKPKTPLSVAEVAELLLTALRDSGSPLGRAALRRATHRRLLNATFNDALKDVIGRGLVTEMEVNVEVRTRRNTTYARRVAVYGLAKIGNKTI